MIIPIFYFFTGRIANKGTRYTYIVGLTLSETPYHSKHIPEEISRR